MLEKHILLVNVFETFQKQFLLLTSKKCLSSTCLCRISRKHQFKCRPKIYVDTLNDAKVLVTQTFENLYGLVWWQPCWRATIFQYNTIENVKNSLADNTDQNALKFDREATMTS